MRLITNMVGLLLLLASTLLSPSFGHSDEYCNCEFNVPLEWEPQCRVFGQLGDGHLIPWHRANQSCLDEYSIQVAAMDRNTLWEICPFDNHTNANVDRLVEEIRFKPSTSTRAIQAFYKQFWMEADGTNDTESHVLLDVVNDMNGKPVDCLASPDLCWTAVVEFFANTPEATTKACKDLHFQQVADLRLEQSMIRESLCSVGDVSYIVGSSSGSSSSSSATLYEAVVSPCQTLLSQISRERTENPTVACSAFGIGPKEFFLKLPQCYNGTVLVSDNADTPTSAALPARGKGIAAVPSWLAWKGRALFLTVLVGLAWM